MTSVLEQAITKGHLTIRDSEGTHCYGRPQKGCNDVQLTVVNNKFWSRVLVSGDVGCMHLLTTQSAYFDTNLQSAKHTWLAMSKSTTLEQLCMFVLFIESLHDRVLTATT
jgi:cyclopropane-fatty-acyl-phospholipid synthase